MENVNFDSFIKQKTSNFDRFLFNQKSNFTNSIIDLNPTSEMTQAKIKQYNQMKR